MRRKKEFAFFEKWIAGIPNRISKSRIILAHRKSGKTSFVQRLFNKLWSENEKVIPFYFDIADSKIRPRIISGPLLPSISLFWNGTPVVENHLHPGEIKEYGAKKYIPYLTRGDQKGTEP